MPYSLFIISLWLHLFFSSLLLFFRCIRGDGVLLPASFLSLLGNNVLSKRYKYSIKLATGKERNTRLGR